MVPDRKIKAAEYDLGERMKKGSVLAVFLAVSFSLVTVLFFSHEYLLRQVGRFLVLEQKISKADYIVILNGRPTERCLAAVDLYKKKQANIIVMARINKQPGSDEFWRRVGKDFKRQAFPERALEAMGIPATAMQFIGDGVASTYDEAKAVRAFSREQGGKSIIIVTSKWHSRRTYLTFKSVFKHENGISMMMFPSPYDTYNPDAWWKSETDVELVFREYLRLFYYYLTLRISFFA